MSGKFQILNDIKLVRGNPNYRNNGLTAIFYNNGNVTLQAISNNDPHHHSLSKKDSEAILNIIKLSAEKAFKKQNKNGTN